MMLGEYGPYAKHFTKEQANYIARESLLDEGTSSRCGLAQLFVFNFAQRVRARVSVCEGVIYPPKGASDVPALNV